MYSCYLALSVKAGLTIVIVRAEVLMKLSNIINNNVTFWKMMPCGLADRRYILKCWRNLLSPCPRLKTLKISMPQVESKPLILWSSWSLLVRIQNSMFQFLAWTLTVLTEIFVDFLNICGQARVQYLNLDHKPFFPSSCQLIIDLPI
jgi:hypothetical protein